MSKVKDEPYYPIRAYSPTAADDPPDLKPDFEILKAEDEPFDPIKACSPAAADDPPDLKPDLGMLKVKDESFDPRATYSPSAAGVSTVRCVNCDYTCLGQDSLDKHMKQRHGHIGRNGRHKCEWCEYSTSRAFDLRRHRVTHTGERPHRCDDCGKMFTHLSNMRRHRLIIHSHGERPYHCDFCCKTFRQGSYAINAPSCHTHERAESGQTHEAASRPHR